MLFLLKTTNVCHPVTTLPNDLSKLITDTSLGSIILFAENFTDIEQAINLTQDLQKASRLSKSGKPLFISIDQEGGRVVRLPRSIATSFTGNMAIGATYQNNGDYYARKVGEVIGAELFVLGINVNHSPDVDVNINLTIQLLMFVLLAKHLKLLLN